jgi:hypothetical protein
MIRGSSVPDSGTNTATYLELFAKQVLLAVSGGREQKLSSRYYVTVALPPELMEYSIACKKFCDSFGCEVSLMNATARDVLELDNLISKYGEFDSTPAKYYASLYEVRDGVYLEVISIEKFDVIYPLTKLTCNILTQTPDKIMAVYPHVMAAIVADQSL